MQKKNHNIRSMNVDAKQTNYCFQTSVRRTSDSVSRRSTLILSLAVTLGVNFYSNFFVWKMGITVSTTEVSLQD